MEDAEKNEENAGTAWVSLLSLPEYFLRVFPFPLF